MGIAIDRLAAELTKLPAATWEKLSAQYPVAEPNLATETLYPAGPATNQATPYAEISSKR